MLPQNSLVWSIAILACGTSVSCSKQPTDVQGAGSTFVAPLCKRWFLEYYLAHPEVQVNYQAVGSGAGVRQFSSGLLDFGASDSAMSDKEITQALEQNPERRGILMLPVTAGSIVIAYNGPEAPDGLKLSRQTYVDIFLGKIKSWSDPAIAAVNPGVHLPDLDITVVRRADGSGTTFAFTNHLAAISPEWKSKVGVGKSVLWPVGVGAKGNAGVAALIQQTPGAIGYIEFGFAELLKMPVAHLENKDGRYIAPSTKSAQAALAGAKMSANMRIWITDPAGADSYPIVTYSWLLCWTNYGTEHKKATALKEALRFCLTEGQKYSSELGYVPLPHEVAARVLKAVDTIEP